MLRYIPGHLFFNNLCGTKYQRLLSIYHLLRYPAGRYPLYMTQEMPRLEVCLSPALLHLYDTTDSIVVIIDVFRATFTIAAALHNGAKCVIPVASVSECIEIGHKTPDSITAGERDGKIADGLQHGNSPSEY